MGRDDSLRVSIPWRLCFNPRARMGRDVKRATNGDITLDVSIHAPAWGATMLYTTFLIFALVSIHAPAWGATYETHQYDKGYEFQSTRPHGARLTAFNISNTQAKFQSTRPHGARLT